MKAPNLFAVSASLLIAGASLFVLRSSDDRVPQNVAPVASINGIKVVDLAPVEVKPTAADFRAAALLADVPVATATLSQSVDRTAAILIGSQLTMPYYSFGNVLSRVRKD
jgi:hypothetical protein